MALGWLTSLAKTAAPYMPMVNAAVGVGAAGLSYYQSSKAADRQEASGREAQRLAQLNADRTRAETAESASRLKAQQRANLGEARARLAASGVKSRTGSQGKFASGMKSAMAGELAWLKKAGASRAMIEHRQGDYQMSLAKAGSAATMANAVSQSANLAIGGMSSAAQWWNLGPNKKKTTSNTMKSITQPAMGRGP